MISDIALTFLAIILSLSQSLSAYSCLNEKQQKVEWFIALRVHGSAGPRSYMILDSVDKNWRETTETELVRPNFERINAVEDLVNAWSDQPPVGAPNSQSHAHAKGLIVFNKILGEGLYYLHSIPKYPEIDTVTGEVGYLSPKSS